MTADHVSTSTGHRLADDSFAADADSLSDEPIVPDLSLYSNRSPSAPSECSAMARGSLPQHDEGDSLQKVYYRPVEAAIRWSGLLRHERHILDVLQARRLPEPRDFPQWPALRLNAERILDAIVNKELPCGINGLADRRDDVTIRHIDLKAWMMRYYPAEKPPFLFSRLERHTLPAIPIDVVQALVFERDSLRATLAKREQELQSLRSECNALRKASPHEQDLNQTKEPSTRSETTHLHIIGALLDLLLGRSPSGQPYSRFESQEAIIAALISHHGDRLGIAERTLQAKFAAAKRKLLLS
jgi:hypothetical protein